MKIFKKFNPNENYLLRFQISMAVVLIAISFAFTRTIDRKVDSIDFIFDKPPIDPSTIIVIPPPSTNEVKEYSKVGSKIVIDKIVETTEKEDTESKEEKFIFDENKTRIKFGIKKTVKGDKLTYHIPDANAEFPGGNDRIPQYLQPRIEYPEEALSIGASCAMEVELVIDKEGWVKGVNIISENEDAYYFRESIREILLAMPKFAPAVSNNRYIESRIIVPIQFILN